MNRISELEQSRIWSQMMDQAYSILDGEKWAEYDVHIRIWTYPSFEENYSWFVRKENEKFQLYQFTWDPVSESSRVYDPIKFAQQLGNFEPNILKNHVLVEHNRLKDLLTTLENISISPFNRPRICGCDGTFNGIEIPNPWGKTKLTWWCDTPDDWSELDIWHSKFKDQILACPNKRLQADWPSAALQANR